jgi:multidrug resistance efflux pump
MNEKKQIEIRSNEVQEILGGVPSRLIRYGVMSVLAVFLILILATWVIRYPDVIRSKIVVTTERPPAPIVSRASGKIDRLFVEDNQKVASGTILGIIQNPARFDDISYLKNQLNEIRQYLIDFNFPDSVKFKQDLQLGPIQDEYSLFIKKYNDYINFKEIDYFPKLNKSLEEQKRMSRIYYDRLFIQKNTLETEYNLALNQFNRDSALFRNNVISAKDFEKSKAEMLSKKNSFEGARTSLAETQMDVLLFDQKIIENQKNHIDQKSKYELEISEAFQNLNAALNDWELNYVLIAPIDGIVTFNKFWSETQNVREGDRVVTIVPENPGGLIGKVELPIRGSGKVKTGLRVNIKFDNYPYMEYGIVKGQVKNISLVPEDNFYMVEVSFPNGLVTTYNKNLELQNQITGNAEIITEELRLIQRIFNPLKALWKERIVRQD